MDTAIPKRGRSALQAEFDACLQEIDRIRENVRTNQALIEETDKRIGKKLVELRSALRELQGC